MFNCEICDEHLYDSDSWLNRTSSGMGWEKHVDENKLSYKNTAYIDEVEKTVCQDCYDNLQECESCKERTNNIVDCPHAYLCIECAKQFREDISEARYQIYRDQLVLYRQLEKTRSIFHEIVKIGAVEDKTSNAFNSIFEKYSHSAKTVVDSIDEMADFLEKVLELNEKGTK